MPFLGDYIGQLLSEIALARMQADLETIRMAELYAAHPLLRTMPVPHVRLPEVNLDVPVLIKASEEPAAGSPSRGGVSVGEMRRGFDSVLSNQLRRHGVEVSEPELAQVGAALDKTAHEHQVPVETAVSVHEMADKMTAASVAALREAKRAAGPETVAAIETMEPDLRSAARTEFLRLRKPPPRLTATVTSAEIRESATQDNLLRLQLRVTEEGVEWMLSGTEGVEKLVPE